MLCFKGQMVLRSLEDIAIKSSNETVSTKLRFFQIMKKIRKSNVACRTQIQWTQAKLLRTKTTLTWNISTFFLHDIMNLSHIGSCTRCSSSPFATWGPIAKGWWSKKFGAPEVVESVSVGDTFVAVLTSLHYLRIYSLGGLNLHTVYLNGNPVALVSYKTSLLVVALRNAGTTHQVCLLFFNKSLCLYFFS